VKTKQEERKICYARVSSGHQKKDLERQIEVKRCNKKIIVFGLILDSSKN